VDAGTGDGGHGAGDGYVDAAAVPPGPAHPHPTAATATATMRRYDLSLCYDNFYRVPRAYLAGVHASTGAPLSPSETMEDVSGDHAGRTATLEAHPHLPSAPPHVSIHPCRHASAMKSLLAGCAGGSGAGSPATPPVEAYLPVFLKMLASAVPTLDYDTTGCAGGGVGG
jgi:ubiquitin-like-conjugating enzyme ATG3